MMGYFKNLLSSMATKQNDIRRCLQTAIERGHIWPVFQPIVSIRTGAIAGFEVLARWNDPDRGSISPAEFIPLLERHDLIDSLSDTLMQQACAAAVAWNHPFFLAFNISPDQLVRDGLPERVAAIASRTGFPLHRLQVEITEGSLFADEHMAYRLLQELNVQGVKVAIDDFGTGHSSLARLESFPFDKLKIDIRFVRSLDGDMAKRRIAAAIVGLGQSLGLAVVAEGVETVQEEAILGDYGCDLGQGWLYGKGMPAEDAHLLLQGASGPYELVSPLDVSPFQQLLQLGSLYRQAPVGLCFVDLDYRHVRVNDRFAAIHGMTVKELEGKSIFDIMRREEAEAAKQFLLASMESDTAVPNHYHARGREYIFFSSQVVDIDGTPIGFSVVSVDAEIQAKAECFGLQRLRECPWAIIAQKVHGADELSQQLDS
jgi:PAS domain S-box-containing protein